MQPLAVMPDDGAGAIADFIKSSQSSIDLIAHRLDDARIVDELASAARRGVKVRVMLDKNPSEGEEANAASEARLKAARVFTSWSDPHFSSTMARAIVSDNRAALVMTFDLVEEQLDGARGFAVLLRDSRDVADLSWMFEADWKRARSSPLASSLVWEPNGARTKLLSSIRTATAHIDIYSDDIRDPDIQAAVAQAVKRGVVVRILAGARSGDSPSGLNKAALAGASVRHLQGMPLSASAMIADDGRGGRTAIVGISMLQAHAKKESRGLGVLISDKARLSRLAEAFAKDWKGGK